MSKLAPKPVASASDDDQQSAAAFGVLGAIAGAIITYGGMGGGGGVSAPEPPPPPVIVRSAPTNRPARAVSTSRLASRLVPASKLPAPKSQADIDLDAASDAAAERAVAAAADAVRVCSATRLRRAAPLCYVVLALMIRPRGRVPPSPQRWRVCSTASCAPARGAVDVRQRGWQTVSGVQWRLSGAHVCSIPHICCIVINTSLFI